MASLSLTRKGDHTGLTYSYTGLTSDPESTEKISLFACRLYASVDLALCLLCLQIRPRDLTRIMTPKSL